MWHGLPVRQAHRPEQSRGAARENTAKPVLSKVEGMAVLLSNFKEFEMNNVWILAQAETNEAPSKISSAPVTSEGEAMTKVPSDSNALATGRESPKPFFPPWLLLALAAVFIFMLFRGPRKKQQEHKKMVQSLRKNDRVRTIGGIIGTIMDIKDDEITLKIDESNNTKIKVASSAIGRNLSKEK